jgi:hypothetical protein
VEAEGHDAGHHHHPLVAFVAAVALLWNTAVGWTDLGLLVVLYVFCGFGITIGSTACSPTAPSRP